MRAHPAAIGFLRRDVSGVQLQWHRAQIQHVARRLGYDLCQTMILDPRAERSEPGLTAAVSDLEADAIITPSLEHFDGAVPDDIVQLADVITVSPENTYARWVLPPLG
ncbi:hypothetical protein [Nocardia sp. NPDC005978]|uniref:hypothetical protein n=1 Tax=unclassified Nocardia TaxID=2637762 RepID=UPI0033A225FE